MPVHNIIKGAIISYISIFLNIAISFFYTPWMIKEIGISDYGLYSLIISFISYFIMDFGLSKAITRFISNYRALGDNSMVSNLLGLTTRIYIYIDAVIFIVLLILYFFLADIFDRFSAQELHTLKLLYSVAGCFSILSFMFRPVDGAMIAFEYFVENKCIDMIQKVGTVTIICIALYFNGGVFFLVLINGATALLTSIVKFFVFKHKAKIFINWKYHNSKESKEIFSFSGWAFGRGLAQRFRLSLIPSILGIFTTTTEISIFSLGMTIEGMVYTLSSAINGLFMPMIARISYARDRLTMNNLMVRVGRVEFCIIAFIFSSFLIFGKTFIHLWVGDIFTNVYYVVLFLIFPNLIIFTEDTAENLVYVENKIRYTTLIILFCSIAGLISSILVASRFGAVGCAACSGGALLANTIIVNFFYHHNMGLDILGFFKKVFFRSVPIVLILSIIVFFLLKNIRITDWIELILSGIIYFIIFCLSMFFLYFNREEKSIIKNILRIKKN